MNPAIALELFRANQGNDQVDEKKRCDRCCQVDHDRVTSSFGSYLLAGLDEQKTYAHQDKTQNKHHGNPDQKVHLCLPPTVGR
jgi:hypothetical protein